MVDCSRQLCTPWCEWGRGRSRWCCVGVCGCVGGFLSLWVVFPAERQTWGLCLQIGQSCVRRSQNRSEANKEGSKGDRQKRGRCAREETARPLVRKRCLFQMGDKRVTLDVCACLFLLCFSSQASTSCSSVDPQLHLTTVLFRVAQGSRG